MVITTSFTFVLPNSDMPDSHCMWLSSTQQWGRLYQRPGHPFVLVLPYVRPWRKTWLSRCSRAAVAMTCWSSQPPSCAGTASVASALPGGTSSLARESARSVARCTWACPKWTLFSGTVCVCYICHWSFLNMLIFAALSGCPVVTSDRTNTGIRRILS